MSDPFVMIDASVAQQDYGIPLVSGGPCPICKAPIDQWCYWNPLTLKYYLFCSFCSSWVKWANADGSLSDFSIVKINKLTSLDIDEDVPKHIGWT